MWFDHLVPTKVVPVVQDPLLNSIPLTDGGREGRMQTTNTNGRPIEGDHKKVGLPRTSFSFSKARPPQSTPALGLPACLELDWLVDKSTVVQRSKRGIQELREFSVLIPYYPCLPSFYPPPSCLGSWLAANKSCLSRSRFNTLYSHNSCIPRSRLVQ